MSLVNEETIQQILAHYDEKHHELIRHQLAEMSNIINDYKEEYQTDKSFQRAFDILFERLIYGSFVLLDKNEE